ncbi:hypothetical protein NDK43_13760 [Neobacillus pocheonensis]|uniref:Uncharacterized protein n=1 Tax=Neobacillus pocheonensis TaxID=363869 RepID=A0ABT0WAB0_9BACI|nr:hypothetical protein [Neobacillus pocheonensis]
MEKMGNEIEKLKKLKLARVERVEIIKGRDDLQPLFKTEHSTFHQFLGRDKYGTFYWVLGVRCWTG